ncbi:signal peptidase I [Paramicrobacterium sp. CJ85]|uniref:signal peptidase I n=1 Tax=Paramicrobacterium sp. CJ85 TaxID=3445355 RepID=UPI003F61D88C
MLLNVAAVAGVICIVLVALSVVFHISLIMFKTGSMTPTIPQGSVAVVREIPASDIAVGDVVTVDREGKLPITHRVTSVEGSGDTRTITMKGDANPTEDASPYTVSHVRIVLASAPHLATVIVWFSNPLILGALTLAASALVTWAFWPREQHRSRPRRRARHARNAAVFAVLIGGAGLAVMPSGAAHAADSVVHGDHITITTVGDAEAMAAMAPNVPVEWQVGVTVHGPGDGNAVVDLSTDGDLTLNVDIRACSVRWVGDGCPGEEESVTDVSQLTGAQTNVDLLGMPTSEERWLRFVATLPTESHGTMTVDVRVTAHGESVSGSSEASTLPRTGTNAWPAIGLAIGAIVVGLIIAGIASHSRRRA